MDSSNILTASHDGKARVFDVENKKLKYEPLNYGFFFHSPIGFSPDGTSAQEANLDTPWGLTISPDGLLYISDSRNNLVRRMTFSGVLETVAGSYGSGHFGDISLVREGELNEPHGLVFLGHDLLLISDHFNNCIKAIKLIS